MTGRQAEWAVSGGRAAGGADWLRRGFSVPVGGTLFRRQDVMLLAYSGILCAGKREIVIMARWIHTYQSASSWYQTPAQLAVEHDSTA